jgi:hypothetical protein
MPLIDGTNHMAAGMARARIWGRGRLRWAYARLS